MPIDSSMEFLLPSEGTSAQLSDVVLRNCKFPKGLSIDKASGLVVAAWTARHRLLYSTFSGRSNASFQAKQSRVLKNGGTVWEEAARKCAKSDAHPIVWVDLCVYSAQVKAPGRALTGDFQSRPNSLLSDVLGEIYPYYVERAYQEEVEALRSYRFYLRDLYEYRKSTWKLRPSDALKAAIVSKELSVSTLFRYCIAHQAKEDVTRKKCEPVAVLQYLCRSPILDVAFAGLVPPELQKLAREFIAENCHY